MCVCVCLLSLGSNCDNSIWAKVIILIKCIRLNVIYRDASLLNLCTVHSLKGRMLMIWHLFQQLALSTYQMLWNQVHVLQSFLLRKAAMIPFILFEKHFTFQFVSFVTVIFEGQVLLCANHYFCTCFVHLIKNNVLCSSHLLSVQCRSCMLATSRRANY